MPSVSIGSSVGRKPAVSITVSGMPRISIARSTVSRVVPGIGVTIATSSPARRFSRLDLPTFGAPTRTTVSPSRSSAPWRARAFTCARSRADRRKLALRVGGAQEVDLLVGKVERRLGEHPELDQRVGERAYLARELAGEASRGGASRRCGRRVDQVGDALGLGEVELAVQERARGEFARARRAARRARGSARARDASPPGRHGRAARASARPYRSAAPESRARGRRRAARLPRRGRRRVSRGAARARARSRPRSRFAPTGLRRARRRCRRVRAGSRPPRSCRRPVSSRELNATQV